uniref:Putative salivary kunitz domain protein n=1 Tax=Ornithodoros turicata TaxID=34597 RepID=A0A2R5LDK0_9ACAR
MKVILITTIVILQMMHGSEGRRGCNYPIDCLKAAEGDSDCDYENEEFYYDQKSKRCNRFLMSMCGGNCNSFISESACMSSCQGAGRR